MFILIVASPNEYLYKDVSFQMDTIFHNRLVIQIALPNRYELKTLARCIYLSSQSC
jgi:hypothetical protein